MWDDASVHLYIHYHRKNFHFKTLWPSFAAMPAKGGKIVRWICIFAQKLATGGFSKFFVRKTIFNHNHSQNLLQLQSYLGSSSSTTISSIIFKYNHIQNHFNCSHPQNHIQPQPYTAASFTTSIHSIIFNHKHTQQHVLPQKYTVSSSTTNIYTQNHFSQPYTASSSITITHSIICNHNHIQQHLQPQLSATSSSSKP
jgi:hypothetical protein